MKQKQLFLLIVTVSLFVSCSVQGDATLDPQTDREYWVQTMLKITEPVFDNLSRQTLRQNMPVETVDANDPRKRHEVSHLEALGRSFAGIAPWLNLPEDSTPEGIIRKEFTAKVITAIRNAVDPESSDYLTFDGPGSQPLVDAAFFAHGLLRSKDRIWPALDDFTRERIVKELKASRKIRPYNNNWVLFTAMVEAALLQFTGECDMERIEFGLTKHKEWYKGDAWYGDGPDFHFDYYNSFVIQPMMTDILEVLHSKELDTYGLYDVQKRRFIRYAVQQELLISPEASYPVIGRSTAYRFGAFQVLAQVALRKELPVDVKPAQVRSALTAVMKRQLVPETFDANGWLTLGVCGHQPEMAESYVSTGSAYLCSVVFLPLGLPAEDEFWTTPAEKWSSQKIWSGKPMKRDVALKD